MLLKNLNSKRFHRHFCCCFSVSIETLIIIHFVCLTFECFFGLKKSSPSIVGIFCILFAFLSPIFLFISNKNHNYGFARLSLYFAEIVGIKLILIIKEVLNGFKEEIFEGLEEDCKDVDSCFLMFIGLLLGFIIELLFLYEQFYFIYLAYYQLSLIQYENSKKLE